MYKELEGTVALVTGGSRGIGRAIAESLAARGAYVIVNYASRADAAIDTVGSCKEKGGDAEALQFEVQDSKAVDEALAYIKKTHGTLGILVNNAGISKDSLMLRTNDEDWQRIIDVNLNGAFYCARAAAKLMIKARGGRIVNISSVVGEIGNVGQAAYVSAKAAMLGLTKALARELASRQITVNAVTPGFIETDMTHELPIKVREEHMRSIPLGRYGTPTEVASLVSFLVSPFSEYITGQVIGINGGMRM